MKKIFTLLLAVIAACMLMYNYWDNSPSSVSPSPAPTAVVTQKPKPTPKPSADKEQVYIGNRNSKKFHSPDCRTLPAEKNRIEFSSREKAINNGYSPCKNCCP